MIHAYVLDTESFAHQLNPTIVVDCRPAEGEAFNEQHVLEQAGKLREQTGAAAVLVHHGAKFWVV